MKRRSRFKRFRRAVFRRLLSLAVRGLGVPLLRLCVGTCRARVVGWDEGVGAEHAGGRAVLFSLWHNRLLVPVWFFRRRNIHVLVSRHEDGELITRILERVGFRAVRGSAERAPGKSRKGGTEGLHAMAKAGRQGHDLAFTPDGPSGPVYSIAPGLITLARLARVKVVPVGIEMSRSWRLDSWDRFQVPKPFSRIVCVFGPPLTLPDDLAEAHVRLAAAMKRASYQAAAALGVEDPFADGDPACVAALKPGP